LARERRGSQPRYYRRRCPDAAAAAAAAAAADDGDARRLDAVFEILRELQGATVLEDPKRRHYNGMEDALRLGHEGPGIRKNKIIMIVIRE
jgi:hypothetical protein